MFVGVPRCSVVPSPGEDDPTKRSNQPIATAKSGISRNLPKFGGTWRKSAQVSLRACLRRLSAFLRPSAFLRLWLLFGLRLSSAFGRLRLAGLTGALPAGFNQAGFLFARTAQLLPASVLAAASLPPSELLCPSSLQRVCRRHRCASSFAKPPLRSSISCFSFVSSFLIWKRRLADLFPSRYVSALGRRGDFHHSLNRRRKWIAQLFAVFGIRLQLDLRFLKTGHRDAKLFARQQARNPRRRRTKL